MTGKELQELLNKTPEDVLNNVLCMKGISHDGQLDEISKMEIEAIGSDGTQAIVFKPVNEFKPTGEQFYDAVMEYLVKEHEKYAKSLEPSGKQLYDAVIEYLVKEHEEYAKSLEPA